MAALDYSGQTGNSQIAAKIGGTGVRVPYFSGTEELSQLDSFQIRFSTTAAMTAQQLIAQPVHVGIRHRITNSDNDAPFRERHFHLQISRLSYHGSSTNGHVTEFHYAATIAPWMWQMTRSTNSRIFQNKTVPEILDIVFCEYSKAAGGNLWANRLTGLYPSRDYCVQYRESDFAFISRLMEEEGIFYRWEYTRDSSTLVLSDNLNGYFHCEEKNPIFGPGGTQSNQSHINSWEQHFQFTAGSVVQSDFDYVGSPEAVLSDEINSPLGTPNSNLARARQMFDYPGGFLTRDDAARLTTLRAEEEETHFEIVRGCGVAPVFQAGAKITPNGTPALPGAAADYVFISVTHTFEGHNASLRSGADYQNSFECIPALRVFRPRRKTHRPFVHGAQTAIVTGPKDELVYTDSLGRVKVKFHWDRRLASEVADEERSCWVRVSQSWAGNGWGSSLLPHIGNEVVVSFLEGDPDRPLITGRVYNSASVPAEDLPDNKLRAVIAEDHTGNFIVFDADDGSVNTQNSAKSFSRTIGDYVEITSAIGVTVDLGLSASFGVGASMSAALSASVDASLGYSSSFSFGGAYGCSLGMSFDWAKGNFVNAGDSVGQIAFRKEAAFVSHKKVTLAAGSDGPDNGVVLVDNDHVILSYGMKDPSFAGSPTMGLWAGVIGGGVLATLGVSLVAASAYLGGKAYEASDADEVKRKRDGSIACGVLGGVTSVVAAGLLWQYAKVWSQVNQPVHGGPLPEKAKVRLGKEGVVVSGDTKVNLFAGLYGKNGTVGLYAKDTKINSMTTTISGDLKINGMLTSANIMDIGQPAAAAAALSALEADLSLMLAESARDEAKDAAQKAIQAAASLAGK